jgi:hypothetical protein
VEEVGEGDKIQNAEGKLVPPIVFSQRSSPKVRQGASPPRPRDPPRETRAPPQLGRTSWAPPSQSLLATILGAVSETFPCQDGRAASPMAVTLSISPSRQPLRRAVSPASSFSPPWLPRVLDVRATVIASGQGVESQQSVEVGMEGGGPDSPRPAVGPRSPSADTDRSKTKKIPVGAAFS